MSVTNTKRGAILEHIRVEFAMHGKSTAFALRLYIENRISRAAFNDAARRGMAAYNARQKRGEGA